MIRYSLKCAEGHTFDSWFQSANAFEKLQAAGHVACAVCGVSKVEKALMAPLVSTAEAAAEPAKPLTQEKTPQEQALAALREHVEKNSDYVGTDFAREARAMYLGEVDARPIWGEAKGDEAKKLIEDGVPVAPLPFTPTRKTS
jgi:hypothetical protein